jgi:hypothetical protein
MTTAVITKRPSAIDQAQSEIARLIEEKNSAPSLVEATGQELAEAQRQGDFQRTAVLEAELSDLGGPQA